jgi:putative N6-adenine-specific DNA methylase
LKPDPLENNTEINTYTAKTVSGLEEILKSELDKLGAQNTQVLKRAVSFQGDKELLYSANYSCRTALRILKPVATFTLARQEDLYQNVLDFPWENWLDPGKTLAVDAVNSSSVFTNTQYISLKTKDAVVDRFRDRTGTRPSVSLDNPDLRINVHIYKESCTISLDSSGQSLHKRGYRKNQGIAPLSEVLAAGLVILSGWDKNSLFFDPMCGSGTILIEAAMAAKSIPAGYFRDEFGFMKWVDYDPDLWFSVKEKADAMIRPNPVPIFGSDISARVIQNAKENLEFANLLEDVTLLTASFEDVESPGPKGTIVCNPPYDERLQLDDIIGFYKTIGNVLKKKYDGYQAWFISSDVKALKFIGLHPSKKIILFNGPLECRFVKFDLY